MLVLVSLDKMQDYVTHFRKLKNR